MGAVFLFAIFIYAIYTRNRNKDDTHCEILYVIIDLVIIYKESLKMMALFGLKIMLQFIQRKFSKT